MKLQIRTDDRIFIVGRPQSGKTTLMVTLFRNSKRAVMIDTLHLHTSKDIMIAHDIETLEETLQKDTLAIYQPETYNHAEALNEVVQLCWSKSNIMLFIDEAQFYMTLYEIQPSLKYLLTAGKNHGLGCCMITQSPVGVVHPLMRRLLDKLICFKLSEEEIEFLEEKFHKKFKEHINKLGEYEFMVYYAQHDQIRTFSKLKL